MEKAESEFAEALRGAANGRVTIDLATAWQCFYSARPDLKGDVTSRGRLARDLRTLAEHRVLSLPASRGSFDRTALPALPKFVRLLEKPATLQVLFDHQTFPWSVPMSFVAGLRRLPNLKIAQQLNDFFRGDWASRVPVPVKERSYEIFGNEKMLERVLEGQFGSKGQLTLELLRCYRVSIVPVHRAFCDGHDILIVENEATFDSISRWNVQHRYFRVVIYGRGREAEKIADFLLDELKTQPGLVYYYGDLDRLGISIPYRLSRLLQGAGGSGVIPAAACYRLLLQQSPAIITALEDSLEWNDSPDSEWLAALDWLPDDIHSATEALLKGDGRIAQEATGWELLCHQNSLI